MALFDFFRRKTEEIPFHVSSGRKKDDRYLLALAEAFEPITKGTKITEVQKIEKRIPPVKLELAARMDELSSRCVNFYASQVIGPGFDLISNDENTKIVCKEFIDRTHLMLKLEDVARDMCILGNGWLEKIFNSNNSLVDVVYIDGRFMDFKRNSFGFVEEDEYGKIVGYVFIDWMGQKKQMLPDKIVHFPLFSKGNELALGFIEPLYHTIYDKLNARKGFSQTQWRTGFPLYVGYVGMPPNSKTGFAGIPPKQEVMDKLADEMEDLQAKHKFVVPYYIKIDKIAPDKTSNQQQLLEFFNQSICAGFGIPYDLAMGIGKGNKATLEVATVRDLDRRIRSMQNKISIILKNEIFSMLKKQYNLKEIPEIRWRDVTPPDLNRLAKRFKEYVETNILDPKDIKEIIYKLEGIPFKKETKEIFDEMKNIFEKLEAKHISIEEAIIALKKMRDSFPEETIQRVIDLLIKRIMLKTTGIETQPIGMSKED